jgi:hypothetical protein
LNLLYETGRKILSRIISGLLEPKTTPPNILEQRDPKLLRKYLVLTF